MFLFLLLKIILMKVSVLIIAHAVPFGQNYNTNNFKSQKPYSPGAGLFNLFKYFKIPENPLSA